MKKRFTLAVAILLANLNLRAQVVPTILADNFVNGLIGVEVDAEGNIWVTEFGTGNDDGKITIIDLGGNQQAFMTGLPSALNPLTGEVAGSFRTYQLADNKVLIVVGEGPHAQGEALLVVDKTDFTPGTPLTLANVEQTYKLGDFVHAQGFLQSDPYNLAWDANGNMLIADAGANSILKRSAATGELSVLKTFDGIPNPLPFGPPFADFVPTDIVAKPDGSGFYVCNLTGFPFLEGAATIHNLDAAGNISVKADGFTCLTDMGFDPKDGNLCVMQFAVFGPVDTTLNFIPGTGLVIKLMPDGSRDTIASGFIGLNPSFTFDAAGDLYVTDLFGFVMKFDFPTDAQEVKPLAVNVQAFPNPFTEKVQISYVLEEAASVRAGIYDMQGRKVHAFDEEWQSAGAQSFTWDGKGAGAGVYVWRLVVNEQLVSGLLHLTK